MGSVGTRGAWAALSIVSVLLIASVGSPGAHAAEEEIPCESYPAADAFLDPEVDVQTPVDGASPSHTGSAHHVGMTVEDRSLSIHHSGLGAFSWQLLAASGPAIGDVIAQGEAQGAVVIDTLVAGEVPSQQVCFVVSFPDADRVQQFTLLDRVVRTGELSADPGDPALPGDPTVTPGGLIEYVQDPWSKCTTIETHGSSLDDLDQEVTHCNPEAPLA